VFERPHEPEYYSEHVWDFMAARPHLSDNGLRRVRMLLGLDSEDASLDYVIHREYQRSAARRERPQLDHVLEIIRGSASRTP
jgi:hypothetical protein